MKTLRRRLAALLLPLALGLCQSVPLPAAPCSVGAAATVCAAAKTTLPYRDVVIDNESTAATIACTDDGSTPAPNTAGSYTMGPGATRQWAAANALFIGPFTCIGGTPRQATDITAIIAGGTGYAANDTVTLTGGTFTTATVITVLTVTAITGAPLTAAITTPGVYTVAPTNPVSQGSSSGSGSGTTWTMVYGVPATINAR